MKRARLAILDMNNNAPNQGLRCIVEIAEKFKEVIDYDVFNVRGKNELPDLSYDIYISSGGPGNPNDDEAFKDPYFKLIDDAWELNKKDGPNKKYFYFICYSFQIVCEHFKLGKLTKRKSTSFGVFPVHKTPAGLIDSIFNGLPNPYYVVDSRDWQLVQPRLEVFKEEGATILSLEKIRTHVEYERAIMAVRLSDEFVGSQFHPEANPDGMTSHFSKSENKEKVIRNFDEKKFLDMMSQLNDPEKIQLTHDTILPGFITDALNRIRQN
jgi:GMP synthase-like glutamine amidotransferase